MKANTANYISFPSGKACLMEDQETSVCDNYFSSGGSSISNGSMGCCGRDLILPQHPKSAALPISDKNSTRSSKSKRSQPSSLVSANSTKNNHNSITNWLNALKLKRTQHKQQQQPPPAQQLGASLSSGEHSRSSSFRSNGSNTSSSSKFKQGGNTTFSICRALRRSVPKRLKHKSKSDNCLYKIDANVSGLDGRHLSYHDLRHHFVRSQISQDSDSSGGSSACGPVNNSHTNRFTRKVFDLTNAISARVHPSSAQNQGLHSKSRLKKTRSLEKDFPFRVVQPNPNRAWHHRVEEECKRRTRSLERNHRYLVTLDSSCRYSREVGSTQVNLDLHSLSNRSVHFPSLHTVPNIINPREKVDLRNRYQPDPTYKPPTKTLLTAGTSVKPTGGNINRSTRSGKTGQNRSGRQHIHTCSKHSIPIRPTTSMSAATSIVNKPARGWLHPDHLFAQDGVNYAVRYIGSLEVNTSMKVLDFDTRSSIAKECINRICEASGLKSADKNRRVDPKIASMLGETPCMDKAGVNVQLTIMVLWLKLSDLDSGEAIFVHDMPNISFASGGDAETLDYVAYVAKDKNNVRSCYVLECGGGLAQEVITTIGQAFELRFKQFLKRTPGTISPPASQAPKPPHPTRQVSSSMSIRTSNQDEVEYYNDLPGKRPPPPPLISPAQAVKEWHKKESTISNLIDFNTDIPEYVNDGVIHNAFQHSSSSSASSSPKKLSSNMSPRDPFDMSPFATQPPCGGIPSPVSKKAPNSFSHSIDKLLSQLLKEDWFHGPVSRQEAENLLQLDGDFLVRESQGSRGQYVLTGMQNSSKKHLLLVDPEGVVRTKDRAFESVSHLIAHHRDNNLPIISAESALRLKRAVVKRH